MIEAGESGYWASTQFRLDDRVHVDGVSTGDGVQMEKKKNRTNSVPDYVNRLQSNTL